MIQIKSAEYLGMPLEEYVWYRHNEPDGIRTKNESTNRLCTQKL